MATFDAIVRKYADKGKTVEIIGLDGASLDRLNRLSGPSRRPDTSRKRTGRCSRRCGHGCSPQASSATYMIQNDLLGGAPRRRIDIPEVAVADPAEHAEFRGITGLLRRLDVRA